MGRNERTRLSKDDEKRVLPQERRFATHIGTGDDVNLLRCIVHKQVVWNEAVGPVFFSQSFNDRMAAPADDQFVIVSDLRPYISEPLGGGGKRGQDIEFGNDRCSLPDASRLAGDLIPNLLKQGLFDFQN